MFEPKFSAFKVVERGGNVPFFVVKDIQFVRFLSQIASFVSIRITDLRFSVVSGPMYPILISSFSGKSFLIVSAMCWQV